MNLIFIFRFVSPYFLAVFLFFFFQRRLWTVGGEGRRVEWERWRIQLHLVLGLSIHDWEITPLTVLRMLPLIQGAPPPSECSPSFRVLPLLRGAPPPLGCSPSCRVLPLLQGAPPPAECPLFCRVNELRKVTPPWPGVCPQ